MRIKTQFIVTMLLFGIVLAAISASAIITNQMVETGSKQENIAASIALGASELSYLANDYIIYRETQQMERWQARFASFSSDVATLNVTSPEQQALVRNIQANTQRLEDVFDSVVSTVGSLPQGRSVAPAFLQVSWSRLSVQSQALASDASRLSQLLDNQVAQLQRLNIIVVIALISVFVAYFLVNYLITQRRALGGLAKLQAGAMVIGAGNLDYKIEEKGNDEIGDLSRAFNQMAAGLKTVTASKTDLEQEIEERKRAEGALKESEEQFRRAVLEAPIPIIMHAEDGQVLQLSRSWTELTGYAPQDMQTFDAWLNQAYGEGADNIREHMKTLLSSKQRTVNAEFPIKTLSGETRYWSFSASSPGILRDGRRFLVGIAEDITERKKVEQLKDEFIGMVSHELRTPLTVVTGAIHTAMLEGLSPEDMSLLLQEAARGAESLADILDNLLELSRHQANRLVLSVEPTSVKEVIDSVVEQLKSKTSLHRLVTDVSEHLPSVYADKVRVERVLHNLIENAIKYSPQGGEVRVFAHQDGNSLVVGVSDQGIGISPADQLRLFQPFQRLETPALQGIKGLGLGLTVCRRLVEAHQGHIWVESEPGKGSTFYFSIPGRKIEDTQAGLS
ncbi:MAG: PAS domain S-box protein [Chloroflexi bacterium]|nr:PAS domain S-box protein [Chloroflexota bacterium]